MVMERASGGGLSPQGAVSDGSRPPASWAWLLSRTMALLGGGFLSLALVSLVGTRMGAGLQQRGPFQPRFSECQDSLQIRMIVRVL